MTPPAESALSPIATSGGGADCCNRSAARWDCAARLVLLLTALAGVITVGDFGVTTDEPIRARTGENWCRWLTGGGGDELLPTERLRHYGAAFDMAGVAAAGLYGRMGGTDEYLPRHLLVLAAAWLGVWGTYRLAGLLGPQPLPFFALLAAVLCPRWTGSLNNPKDVPFAAAMVRAAWAMVRWLAATPRQQSGAGAVGPGAACEATPPSPPLASGGDPCTTAPVTPWTGWRRALLAAVMAGVATAVRPFGALLLPAGLVAGLVTAWLARDGTGRGRAGQAVGFVAAGLATAYLLWPTLWVTSPTHLAESIAYLSRFPDGGSGLFFGEVYQREDYLHRRVAVGPEWCGVSLPAYSLFIPVWVGLTTPDVVVGGTLAGLALVGAGLWRAMRARSAGLPGSMRAWAAIAGWVVLPVVVVAIKGANFSRTGRHFLFLVPPMCLLAGLAAAWLWDRVSGPPAEPVPNPTGGEPAGGATGDVVATGRRWSPGRIAAGAGLLLMAAGLADAAWAMVRLHPYQAVYFNRMAGGLPGAAGRFDVGNWSEGFAEAFAWLRRHAAEHGAGDGPIRVHAVAGTDVAAYHAAREGMLHNPPDARFFVSMVLQGWEGKLTGPVLHRVSRDGVDLAVVRRIAPPLTGPATVACRPGRMADKEPAPWRTLSSVHHVGGVFDVSQAGVTVPPQTSLAAEDDLGAWASLRWTVDAPRAGTMRLFYGAKGAGTLRVNGKATTLADRLRFLAFGPFAGLAMIDVPVVAGRNVFEAEWRLRHDPLVYLHWQGAPAVRE